MVTSQGFLSARNHSAHGNNPHRGAEQSKLLTLDDMNQKLPKQDCTQAEQTDLTYALWLRTVVVLQLPLLVYFCRNR